MSTPIFVPYDAKTGQRDSLEAVLNEARQLADALENFQDQENNA